MGVVVTDRAVHFGHQWHIGDGLAGFFQTHQHVGKFLAYGRGAGGLTVRAAQHRHFGKLVGQAAQSRANAI